MSRHARSGPSGCQTCLVARALYNGQGRECVLLGVVGDALTSLVGVAAEADLRRIAAEGPMSVCAGTRLDGRTHPLIEGEARPQFLIRKYELGVFASMKAVEVRVRHLGGFPDDIFGVDLMNRAFGPKGALTDQLAAKGEQEGMRALFTGAYAVLRNPPGHREVRYDASEAADAVRTASLLMRILDRAEARVAPSPPWLSGFGLG